MTRLLVRRFLDDYGRNGANLLLLLLIPITFVLAAASALANAAKLLGGAGGGPAVETVTAGWASAFLAAIAMYFQVSASRGADRRLVTAGAKPRRLGTARLPTGLVLACLASVAALAALAARGDVDDPWRVVAGTLLFAVIYVGLGAAVGALLPSAVNGTVLLLFIWILDVFFGPTLSGTDSPIVRLLPTHFVSLWIVDLPAGHSGLSTLSWSLIWVGGSLTLAFLVVAGHEPHRNPRSLWAHRRPAQMLATLKAGSRDWLRTPVLWVLLAAVPAVFILLSDAVTPHGHTPIKVRENGVSRIDMVDLALIHAGTMAPIAVASLGALVGVFMVLDSRAADARLVIAGESRLALVASRLMLVLTATAVSIGVSLAVTATVFEPQQWVLYAAGNIAVAVTYALIGMLVAPLFGRVSSVFLAFLIPFLDLGLWQSPMLRGEPDTWAQYLPGYGGIRIVIDGALTPGFDTAAPATAAAAWLIFLLLATALVITPRVRSSVARAHDPQGVPSRERPPWVPN